LKKQLNTVKSEKDEHSATFSRYREKHTDTCLELQRAERKTKDMKPLFEVGKAVRLGEHEKDKRFVHIENAPATQTLILSMRAT
jgi:hypothetical protein